MNEDKTLQGIQIIALFMGWNQQRINTYLILKEPNTGKLAYNESWDLLMPVIEKIESLPTDIDKGEQYQFNITADCISITRFDDGSGIISHRPNKIGESKIQSSFEVVLNFCCDYLKINRI